jgi:hypothetical protein
MYILNFDKMFPPFRIVPLFVPPQRSYKVGVGGNVGGSGPSINLDAVCTLVTFQLEILYLWCNCIHLLILPELLQRVDKNMTMVYALYSYLSRWSCVGWNTWIASFPNAMHCIHKREYEFATHARCRWRQDALERFEAIEMADWSCPCEGEKTH